MAKISIFKKESLTEERYLETWKLDNKIFSKEGKISKKKALEWFYASKKSTIVLWDNEKDTLIGYITPFLLKHSFSTNYLTSNLKFNDIKAENFCDMETDKSGDVYLFSVAVAPEYRGKIVEDDEKSKYYNKKALKILTEELLLWFINVKKKKISINYIFSEKIQEESVTYLTSLGLQPCFAVKNAVKYARLFGLDMFKHCDNKNEIEDLYKLDDVKVPFDVSLLKNHNYLSIKNNKLYYKNLELLNMVEKYGHPLEVAYIDMITERIKYLKILFASKIKKYKYRSKYNYAYATKANYYSEVVITAQKSADLLETSSAYDINIIIELFKTGFIKSGFTVICNGFKNEKYFEAIKTLLDYKINVIPVIENENELDELLKLSDYKINVGLRYNSDFESRLIKNNFNKEEEFDNRFGFNKEDIIKVAEKIGNSNNLTLKLLHFHFGGTITNIDNYIKGYRNIFAVYCELKKNYDSLQYFDFGGGFPVQYSLTFEFDYDYLVDQIVKTSYEVSEIYQIVAPELIGEHGRFTAADHSFYIYKIDLTKFSNNKKWYIINGSLMNMTPDMWGIQQDFTILPINLLENKCVPVCLGGETCDPDDRYFLQDKNLQLFLPEIKEGQTLYIAIFSVGAYQEIISGIGGVHHCMIPEGNELLIYEKNNKMNFVKVGEIQNKDEMLKILSYKDTEYLKKFR